MKFSVLLPTWNRGNVLPSAIQSICDQTYDDWELVIVDDGSTDGTWQSLEKYKDPRIKKFRRPHLGLIHALNFGTQQCQGDIIVKQDSDDASLPNRLEVIDREMKTDFFYHGMYQLWYENDLIYRKYRPALPLDMERITKEQYIPGAYAYTREFAKDIPYRDVKCSEDWMLILDGIFKGKSIGYTDQGLYEYVLQTDSNSLVSEYTGAYAEDELKMQEYLKEYGVANFKYPKRR